MSFWGTDSLLVAQASVASLLDGSLARRFANRNGVLVSQGRKSTGLSGKEKIRAALNCDEVPVPCPHALGTATRR